MNQQPSLWWAYDTESQSFSALPPGPLLLPAIFIAAFVALYSHLRDRSEHPENVLPPEIISSDDYQRKKQRYYDLIHKKVWGDGLTVVEHYELEELKQPWWVESGTWTY